MSVIHSELFTVGYPLIDRIWLGPGAQLLTAPPQSAWIRVSQSAAGGFKDDAPGWGGGAAFVFAAEVCAPGDSFSTQTGDTQFTRPSANTSAGDSWVKRGDNSVLTYADRGRPDGTGGLVANCTGTVRRAGSSGTSSQGGASAGDDADTYPLGFGGRGASSLIAAYFGGGGGFELGHDFPTFPAGDGLSCVEFFSRNPGY